MIISPASLKGLFTGFSVLFNKGVNAAPSHWKDVAMKVGSSTAAENYAWLTDMPGVREWLGDRVIHDLAAAEYKIKNRDFELTLAVPRNNIEDDQYGVFGPLFEQMGHETATHPDELVFSLLGDGFAAKGYDLQPFFYDEHRGFDEAGKVVSVPNMTPGEAPAWYLLDCKQPVKPLIYQERKPFNMVSMVNENDPEVFYRKNYVYGVDGRSNVGFGLWQQAHGSKAALNDASFTAARASMASLRRASGKPLGITPTHLVVPPALERVARQLVNSELINAGESNVWKGSVELIVTPYVS